MSPSALERHRFTFYTLLRVSLVAGAVYDLGFAALLATAPELANAIVQLPMPEERFYLWTIAVLLTIAAAFYLVTARDPRRYSGNVAVAIGGRSLGFVVFAWAASGRPELAGLWLIGIADLVFALLHAACWLPTRHSP
jgi:hypothetical protein